MGTVTSSTRYRPSQNSPSLTESYATAKQKKRDLSNPQLCLLKENWIWLVLHHMEPIKDIKHFVEYISRGCWQLCWVRRLDSVICASPESSSWITLLSIFHWTDHSLTQFVHPTKNKQVEQLFCTYGFLCQRRLFCSQNSLLDKISLLL